MKREPTAEQLDPLGALSGRLLTVGGALVAFGYSAVLTIRDSDEIDRPAFAISSLLVLAGACLALVFGSRTRQSPFSSRRHGFVIAASLVAFLLLAYSQWGRSDDDRQVWGAFSVGVVLLAIAPYRPWREILHGGVVASAFVALVTVAEFPALASDTPDLVLLCIALTPIIGMTIASAAFSRVIVASLDEWRVHVAEVSARLDAEARQAVARSVQQDRVTVLNRDVVPFLTDILRRDAIGGNDARRARQISDSVRRIMVAESERTWLDEFISGHRHLLGAPGDGVEVVCDSSRVADSMNVEQRAVLRALIAALLYDLPLQPGSLTVWLTTADDGYEGELDARLAPSGSRTRGHLTRYAAVFRAVFRDVRFEYRHSALTLKFSYGRR
ncbi:glycosyltransferase family protein [Planctomonas psychrotolerans]|uniref:hypothetical protein n=1 Tax=Planctomonas psychrotolerans TaxID=2528712 RepID=UPI00123A8832|nr:hypothetical protein [Planctomonas psychrotolerans]